MSPFSRYYHDTQPKRERGEQDNDFYVLLHLDAWIAWHHAATAMKMMIPFLFNYAHFYFPYL